MTQEPKVSSNVERVAKLDDLLRQAIDDFTDLGHPLNADYYRSERAAIASLSTNDTGEEPSEAVQARKRLTAFANGGQFAWWHPREHGNGGTDFNALRADLRLAMRTAGKGTPYDR